MKSEKVFFCDWSVRAVLKGMATSILLGIAIGVCVEAFGFILGFMGFLAEGWLSRPIVFTTVFVLGQVPSFAGGFVAPISAEQAPLTLLSFLRHSERVQ